MTDSKEYPFKPKLLEDVGTRYEHLQDLTEVLQAGIDIFERKPMDKEAFEKYWKLKYTLESIQTVMSHMGGFKKYQEELEKVINGIERLPIEIPEPDTNHYREVDW